MKITTDSDGLRWKVFRFGYKYTMRPFRSAPEFSTVIPLRCTDRQNFGLCMVANDVGKVLPKLGKVVLGRGVLPLSADICSGEVKLPAATVKIMEKESQSNLEGT